ncbi:hypothetical protein [Burkholderia arboris]|uniref:hypothetical protein n=1 Tax=Burkholderia arboris TaxID=488730 RepID=UPI00158CC6BF|nr:hypothetical protein [Burkholderia arboris]
MSLYAIPGAIAQLAADVPSQTSAVSHASAPSFGREYLTTEEAADLLGLRPQTLRKAYSSDGCYYFIVPKKAANRRLYWKADLVRSLIEGA